MYNTHRGMVPAPNSRLTELLDQLRQEFESQSRSTGEFEHQCMSASSPPPAHTPPRFLAMSMWSLPLPFKCGQSINGCGSWVANFAETFSN